MTAAARLDQAFAAALGRPPGGLWSAPGRVNLIGEHVDYSDGVVLPFAIKDRTRVAAAIRTDGLVTVRSLQREQSISAPVVTHVDDLEPRSEEGWSSYALGAVWALRKQLGSDLLAGGVDLMVDGQVPEGAGLSSSAALECAVALACTDLADATIDPLELARIAQLAENDFVGVPCGLMDQAASMCCVSGHALLFDTRDQTVTQVPMDPGRHELALLLIRTVAQRSLRDGAYAQRRQSVQEAAAQLGLRSLREAAPADLTRLDSAVLSRRAEHVIGEIDRVQAAAHSLESADFTRLGELMTASHRSLRDLFEVSCVELDLATDACIEAGALGARMTGGGFGGSVISLVPAATIGRCTAAVKGAFARHRLPQPHIESVTACGGATRDSRQGAASR